MTTLEGTTLSTAGHPAPFRYEHRGAGGRRTIRYTTRPTARDFLAPLLTLMTIGVALFVLGLVGHADLQRECDQTWNLTNTTSTAQDRLTCADTFPGRYPATDAVG